MKRILSLILVCVMVLSVAAVAGAEDVTLRMAVGYNNANTGLAFSADIAGEGITLADGVTYHTGDLKPTWVEMEKVLSELTGNNIIIDGSAYQGNSDSKEFDYWKEQLDKVDMVFGPSQTINAYGEQGSLVNLAEYADKIPNVIKYLDENPIVRLSITANTDTGAFYFAPYFDGVNDIEKMPLMRVDYLQKLLDGEGEFTAEACKDIQAPVYQPFMPTSGSIAIETPNADGTAVITLTKNYDAYGNIIEKMNEKGVMSGVEAVNMLREYIDKTYDGYYGATRSNLFAGYDAAWDADEMVALLRCVVANPQSLNGTDSIQGLFSREENSMARRPDVYRLGGVLFGVRGYESRQDYLYVDTDGQLVDGRQTAIAYEAADKMHDIAMEGLISADFMSKAETSSTKNYLPDDLGFMSYDYNQTQTILNAKLQEGEKYMAIMVPVSRWFDGTNEEGVYMRFTESWRSVKNGNAWAISKAGVEGSEAKLNALLALIDYAYSEKGQILMSYGPDAFIKTNADGSYVTFNFNGKEMPVIADGTKDNLWALASGNYTNFARRYLGSTLSFIKSQAFEYQCTHDVGKEGAAKLSAAIALGTIKHPELAVTDNGWYTSVPSTLPHYTTETDDLNALSDLQAQFSNSFNLFDDIVVNGIPDGMTAEEQAAKAENDWYGYEYTELKNDAWGRLLNYFNGTK
jgi:putative aldouronate transport system substrate-binding protein